MKVKLTFAELQQLKPHPLCALLNNESYRPSAEEIAALRTSIARHGVRARAVLVPDKDGNPVVLDGWNTIQQVIAVYGHGKTDQEVAAAVNELLNNMELLGDFKDHEVSYVEGAQLGGRNTDAAQRAALVIDLHNFTDTERSSHSVESLAEFASVSKRTVEKVRRIDKEGCAELGRAIRVGRVSLNDAIELLALSKGQQDEVLTRLMKDLRAVKEAVAEIRAAKATEKTAEAERGGATDVGGRTDLSADVQAATMLAKSKREQNEIIAKGPKAVKAEGQKMRAQRAVTDKNDALAQMLKIEQATTEQQRAKALAAAGFAPGYGKRNVDAALDQAAAERGSERHTPPIAPEQPTAFEEEMATPGAPRAKGAPAASSGPGIVDLQMELRLWWKGKTVAERAALLRGLESLIEAAWDASGPGRIAWARSLFGTDPPVPLMNGTSVSLAIAEQSARVKRKTRDADTLRLCEMIEGRI
jgi:hypothetical protein